MAFESRTSKFEEDHARSLDGGIKEMVSTLTRRVAELHAKSKQASNDPNRTIDDVEEPGIRVITLAGNNTGATMRADLSELEGPTVDHEMLGAYTNSNYQAVNNSIMLHGSYTADDPGVHIFISENVEEHEEVKEKKKEKKKKKKEKDESEKDESVDGEKSNTRDD